MGVDKADIQQIDHFKVLGNFEYWSYAGPIESLRRRRGLWVDRINRRGRPAVGQDAALWYLEDESWGLLVIRHAAVLVGSRDGVGLLQSEPRAGTSEAGRDEAEVGRESNRPLSQW